MSIDLGVLLLGFMLGFVGAKIWILGMQIIIQRKKLTPSPHIKLCD
ncbi:MAG: hypothetical protein V1672_00580 [Candidatus Diapherotrites archaeon]